jgi:sugar transferase (PEP-CTERM system associated)
VIRLFRQYFSIRKAIFIAGEAVLIFGAVTLASFVLLGREYYTLQILLDFNWLQILLITVVAQISLYFNDLYDIHPVGNVVDLASRLVQSVGVTSIVLAVIYFFLPDMIVGRWIFFVSVVFLLLFLFSWRLLYAYAVHKKLFAERTLIVGDGELATDLLEEIRTHRDISYDVRLIVGQENGNYSEDRFGGIPVRYGFDSLCDLAETEQISNIIVALDQKRGVMPYKKLLNCKVKGISIIDGESFYERITGKLLVEKINPSWLIFSDGFVKSPVVRFAKRLAGFLLSAAMLVVFSPLILVIIVAIKLDSRGPVIFSQERVGEKGQIFQVHKFRSMKEDAEGQSGPVWAEENDPRITRVGRVIRKLRMDELPQLWNVLKGEMSIVGPRPERPFFVEKLKSTVPYYKERFAVKPGVTGWAQVKYGYGATEQDALEKLKYDLYYIKNMSLTMDLIVILHTVKIVLLGRGSR